MYFHGFACISEVIDFTNGFVDIFIDFGSFLNLFCTPFEYSFVHRVWWFVVQRWCLTWPPNSDTTINNICIFFSFCCWISFWTLFVGNRVLDSFGHFLDLLFVSFLDPFLDPSFDLFLILSLVVLNFPKCWPRAKMLQRATSRCNWRCLAFLL